MFNKLKAICSRASAYILAPLVSVVSPVFAADGFQTSKYHHGKGFEWSAWSGSRHHHRRCDLDWL